MKRIVYYLSFVCLCFCTSCHYFNHPVIPLYEEEIPCKNPNTPRKNPAQVVKWMAKEVNSPELIVYQPAFYNNTQTAVIICPGGGYSVVGMEWEGSKIAKWYSSMGVTAFILKYRLPVNETPNCKTEIPLMDAKKAIEIVRSQASKWDIDPKKIGIMGFSAGGHIAASLSCHFEDEIYKPDFSILIYPVISMKKGLRHDGSTENLLGVNPSDSLIHHYSMETQVTINNPPTLLIHAADDSVVKIQSSIAYFEKLVEKKVPAGMHIFEKGGHVFFNEGKTEQWEEICKNWLKDRKLL